MYFEFGMKASELKAKTQERTEAVLSAELEKEISNAAWNGVYQVEFHFDPTQFSAMKNIAEKLKTNGFATTLVAETKLGYGYITVSWA